MAKRQFILLKDIPDLKKGAILEEKCEDGSQAFESTDEKFLIDIESYDKIEYSQKEVTTQPQWFMEIHQVPVPKKHIEKVKKYIKGLK